MIDHNTESRKAWINDMRAVLKKHGKGFDSPRVSIVHDSELKLLFRRHRWVGVLLGAAYMLALIALLWQFPVGGCGS